MTARPRAGDGTVAQARPDALWALLLFAVDPDGTGLVLRARASPARDRVLEDLRALLEPRPWRRVPTNIPDSRLLGGLDLAATLRRGHPVAERGLLAQSDRAVLVLAMAERLTEAAAARFALVMDEGEVRVERDGFGITHPARFGLVALDEGIEADENAPVALADRLAFRVELGDVRSLPSAAGSDVDEVAAARRRLRSVQVPDALLTALCEAALALGIGSVRAPLLALRATRAAAALGGRDVAVEADAALAARLVLAPRAGALPAEQPPQRADPPQEARPESGAAPKPPDPADVVLEAALAAIPPDLLARLRADGASRKAGRGVASRSDARRGRPAGLRRGPPRGGARLALVETLRSAAPWQPLRRAEARRQGRVPAPVEVRAEDFRIAQLKQRARSTTIFVVDASGSSAFHRLAEAKGAVELLLAESYVRRDQVALIGFRGRGADILLPPTRSLVRAKRSLAALPGGGGTPLAAGLDAGAALAEALRRRGEVPTLVVLSDGRANVDRDGIARRDRAEAEALAAAQGLRRSGLTALFIDTSPRPDPAAHRVADAMGALYLPLPRADAGSLSRAVRTVRDGARP